MPKIQELLWINVYEKESLKQEFYKSERITDVTGLWSALENSIKWRVFLPVNPTEVTIRKDRVVNEIQTNRPGRFVILDWGLGMVTIDVRATTGRVLPFGEVIREIAGVVPEGFEMEVGSSMAVFKCGAEF